MPDLTTTLALGDFVFGGLEIPESMPFGGAQKLVVHQYPGGARSVQAMGRDDAPIAWSGVLSGATAMARAHYLDTLRAKGGQLTLTYHDFNYTVVIEKFEANLKSSVRIPYSMSVVVVRDNTSPVTTIVPNDFDAAVRGDNDACQSLGGQIGDSTLSSLMGTMNTAIAAVSDFAKATTATIQSVVGPVGAVIARTNTLIGSSATVVNSVASLGGILPNNPIATQAARMASQVVALTQYPLLVQILNTANRMQGNLGGIISSQQTRTDTVAGGTLFDLAAKWYGDASKWTFIAQANGLTDPQVTGVQVLQIPTTAPATGGVPLQ